jgi:Phosphopantetheine attachment site
MDLDAMIAEHATGAFDDSTPLPAAGLESLSLLRLVVAAAADQDGEIDAARLAQLRVVADLKAWLTELAAS